MASRVHYANNPYKVAIHDLDGSITDTRGLTFEALDQLTHTTGHPASQDEIGRALASGSVDGALQTLVPSMPPHEAVELFYQHEEKIGYDNLVPYDGTLSVLENLHTEQRMHNAINTNRARPSTLRILDVLGLLDEERFGLTEDLVACPSETIRPKPFTDGLQYILDQLGVTPHEALSFGDTVADIKPARELGMLSIAHLNGYSTARELRCAYPDDIISSIRELPSAIIVYQELAHMRRRDDRL